MIHLCLKEVQVLTALYQRAAAVRSDAQPSMSAELDIQNVL